MGTKYAVEHFLKAYNWDNMTRLAALPSQPGKINVHEFDYKGENQVVYQKNGVTIKILAGNPCRRRGGQLCPLLEGDEGCHRRRHPAQ